MANCHVMIQNAGAHAAQSHSARRCCHRLVVVGRGLIYTRPNVMPPLTIFATVEKMIVNPTRQTPRVKVECFAKLFTPHRPCLSVSAFDMPVTGNFAGGVMLFYETRLSLMDSDRNVGSACPSPVGEVRFVRWTEREHGLRAQCASAMLRPRRAAGYCPLE